MASAGSPPPSYHEELPEGETTLQEKTLVPESQENVKPVRAAPPPLPIPPGTLVYEGSALVAPTPLPYTTPLTTPFTTAPNTPMFFGQGQPFPGSMSVPQITQHSVPMFQHQMMMAPYQGFPMQPMCAPSLPPAPAAQQANPGINVVVNANANSGAESSAEGGLTAPDGTKLKICPACKKGVLVREQYRKRAKLIKFVACITSCCLCCLPCIFLRCNFVDQCPACHHVYGKPGGKKAKKPKYA